ncbi:acetoin reductase [Neisseria perflava]|uniref:acetoin reductase n=1 Tax=Neisseria perflava TaxID=33053 RepID=UPI0020A10DFC|nr:acetoin reductase [Neisseria perflava]MCP1660760.1 meso-butanediol dehydrogenase/(S,S)-butanediol dehydrogenase/diacetyl reductase [Neisseria perflava]
MSNQKVAVVTGSAAGLGKAIATRLAKDGFAVVLHDINAANLAKTKAEFDAAGYANIAVEGNSANCADQFRLVDEAVKAFGRVDVFVNNAGVESVEAFLDIREEEIDRVLGINIKGVIFGTQAAAEQMKKQDGIAKIINACSIAGHESYEMLSLYCATKHAVRSFTHSTAKELAPYGIRVNAYCPGVADTPMWERIDAAFVKHKGYAPKQAWNEFTSGILAGRPQEPEDVANLVSFLASEDSDYITGQTILTDGGMIFR